MESVANNAVGMYAIIFYRHSAGDKTSLIRRNVVIFNDFRVRPRPAETDFIKNGLAVTIDNNNILITIVIIIIITRCPLLYLPPECAIPMERFLLGTRLAVHRVESIRFFLKYKTMHDFFFFYVIENIIFNY